MNLLNSKNAIILASGIAVLGGITYFYQQSVDQKIQAARTQFYQVQKTLESEMAVLTEAEKVPGARFDVDAKLPKSVAELRQLIDSAQITDQVRFEAMMKLASLYLEHSEESALKPSIELMKRYADAGKTAFQKSSIYFMLGSAQERSNLIQDAMDSYQKALKQEDQGLKSELLMSLVRVCVKGNDLAKAKSFSEQLTKEAPGSKAAQEAQKLISTQG